MEWYERQALLDGMDELNAARHTAAVWWLLGVVFLIATPVVVLALVLS